VGSNHHLGSLAALVAVGLAGCRADAEPAGPVIPIGTELGQRAPAIAGRLPADEEFTVRMSDGSPVVLVFYRTIECGLCRLQLDQMQENLPAYQRSGAEVVAVTLDSPEASRSWLQQAGVLFPIVSVDSATFRSWGALAADETAPLPATYVLDGSGVVRFRHIGRNASDRTSDAEVVAILESLPDT
jgi:peroxiredoxin